MDTYYQISDKIFVKMGDFVFTLFQSKVILNPLREKKYFSSEFSSPLCFLYIGKVTEELTNKVAILLFCLLRRMKVRCLSLWNCRSNAIWLIFVVYLIRGKIATTYKYESCRFTVFISHLTFSIWWSHNIW